jgi:hypothetical protein
MKTVTIFATLFSMSFVLAGNASAVVIGPLGNATVVQAPIGTGVNPFGVPPGIVRPPVASEAFVRPAFNPFFRPAFNPFFRPAFNPFFRPVFNPFFHPFFGADVDVDFPFGVGFGAAD